MAYVVLKHCLQSPKLGSELLSTVAVVKFRNLSVSAPLLSNKDGYRLLIVGGGTAGCSMAAKFAPKLGAGKVAVLEPNDTHYYQSMFTLVGGGVKSFNQTHQTTGSVLPKECDWIHDSAASFDPDHNTVTTGKGKVIKYDYMLVAMGLQLNYNMVKGCAEALKEDPMVVSIYSPKFVHKVLPAAEALKEGNAIYTYPNTPVKCAGAAQKILYLTEDSFRKKGKLDKVNFIYNTALGVIFPVPRYAQALEKVAASRNIKWNKLRNLIEVRHETKEAIFEIVGEPGKSEVFKYSMLHVAPPMSTPSVLWKTPLVDATNFVSVNSDTLQHTKYKNIFAMGDCANTPTSKTAAAVASELGTASRNLQLVLDGKEPDRKYNGYTSCPLVVSRNHVILAEFGYNQVILETFPFDQTKPRRSMYFLKVHAMPWIYWNLMIKGYWHGPSFFRKLWRFGL